VHLLTRPDEQNRGDGDADGDPSRLCQSYYPEGINQEIRGRHHQGPGGPHFRRLLTPEKGEQPRTNRQQAGTK
jgi:hypothetical protein